MTILVDYFGDWFDRLVNTCMINRHFDTSATYLTFTILDLLAFTCEYTTFGR